MQTTTTQHPATIALTEKVAAMTDLELQDAYDASGPATKLAIQNTVEMVLDGRATLEGLSALLVRAIDSGDESRAVVVRCARMWALRG